MREPLIVLIVAYAISVLGLVLIPGIDENGEPWRMDFFHAFYFVSYLATTIGFGELPYTFSDAQRLWSTIIIYLTVISWLYAIGKILTLIQDPALRRALTENRFQRQVRQIREPFYLVCGYGDTGSLVTKALTQRGVRVVAIDIEQDRINELILDELSIDVPGLSSDAGEPYVLKAAGLQSPYCAGVLALTDNDHTNLEIAISSKLLNPKLKVICRAETQDTQANMASFGTDHIINPFEAFAGQLATALHSPDMHLIFEWLTQLPRTPLTEYEHPPKGDWIICGYGRFGKAVEKFLSLEGISTTIIEAKPKETNCEGRCIVGRGTEAVTLHAAKIDKAAGIVAGTDDDANNLSILITAKDLNPDVYTVARQNKRSNDLIFDAAHVDQVMQHSVILSLNILALLTAPLLSEFLKLARGHNNDWAKTLTEKLKEVADNIVPDIWTITINEAEAPAVYSALDNEERNLRFGHLTSDPRDYKAQLKCLPLLLKRKNEYILLPEVEQHIERGDQILFCGRYGTAQHMDWTLKNYNALRYVETGDTHPDGYFWRWLVKHRS